MNTLNLQDWTYSSSASSLPADASASPKSTAPHGELRRLLEHNHLMDRQPVYFAGKMAVNSLLWFSGMVIILRVHSIWLQLAVACYLAFVSLQIGFLVHDAGHQHVCNKRWKNTLVGLIYANLLLGLSFSWWVTKHNQHHGKPNQPHSDPDLDFTFLAVTEEDALAKKGFVRFLVNWQAYFFFPFLFLEIFSLKLESWWFLWRKGTQNRLTELVLLILHYAAYGLLLIHFLGPGRALMVALVYNALFGFSLSMVFSTNHLGRPLLPKNAEVDFLTRQVVTARNLRAHWLTDYCFGLLGCQIEHHLFTTIPRNKLRSAQRIVRPFCELYGIDYHETGVWQCYREVLCHLNRVSRASRKSIEGDGYGQSNGN